MAAARVAIPLELEGVLDSAREWEIEVTHMGDAIADCILIEFGIRATLFMIRSTHGMYSRTF